MSSREEVIANSIRHAILESDEHPTYLGKVSSYFNPHWLTFERIRGDLFSQLRKLWEIDDEAYCDSFTKGGKEAALTSIGDMGYSGSTFFTTADSKYLVKSVPRHFEHSFFRDDMLDSYVEYMKITPHSLLVRITDFLQYAQQSIGSMLGTAPSHHIGMSLNTTDRADLFFVNSCPVMENIQFGQILDERSDGNDDAKWESWDLKPMSYFYPERDVAGGVLSSEATKSKLADDFSEKIILDLHQSEEFRGQLEKDTALLRKCNAVDYSLFLVRIPIASMESDASKPRPVPPTEPPFAPAGPPSWRTGIRSADGQYIYRASILDFFWAKHKVHAQAMTGLIKSYNVVDPQGPMSVTTTAKEYRERFLRMCSEFVEERGTGADSR